MTDPGGIPARQRRALLEVVSREQLARITARYEMEVADRRSAASHVDAIVRAKGVDFAEVLGLLVRDELKAICEALGLDSNGREKQALIDRILGTATVADADGQTTTGNRNGRRSGRDEPSETSALGSPDPNAKLTRQQLESYLWAAADILRGSIDSSDYKNFIFGLLFLKRLSDRFEEECEQLVAEDANPEDPDEHQFFVPKRARWSQIQKGAMGLGELLNKASAALEEANAQALEGVLAGIDYNDERKLGDARHRDNVLHRLVLHFSKINLRNDHLAEPDMLGRAYEYLIEKFADDAGKKGGEFYTPHMVVRLIVELLEPKEGMRICDPTCGSGGMLIQTGKYIVEHGGRPHNFSLFGQEKNLGTWAICKMNMLLHGYPDARIEKGDVIRNPKLLEAGELMLFDRVIANPPFSLDAWGHETAGGDAHGRFRFGVPPKTKGDFAFVQHMVATLNAKGKMGVVMPHGVLFRGASEGEIRRGLLKEDLIEAVVGLPTNLFYGTGIPAAILVVNRDKPKARRAKVLLVEASREFREGSAQNYLREQDVRNIAATAHAFRDVDKYARVVDLAEIEENDWNLNISRYVDTAQTEQKVDVASAIAKLRETEQDRNAAKAVMDRFLRELGYDA
jgi:type I restriction enzyme M protein